MHALFALGREKAFEVASFAAPNGIVFFVCTAVDGSVYDGRIDA